ncbi:hypothetical protein H8E77_05180 [bacterium]|nr:hypothetical protein [bacterium]
MKPFIINFKAFAENQIVHLLGHVLRLLNLKVLSDWQIQTKPKPEKPAGFAKKAVSNWKDYFLGYA